MSTVSNRHGRLSNSKLIIRTILVLLLSFSSALAQTNTSMFPGLPQAMTPLTGSEIVPLTQNGVTKKVSVSQLSSAAVGGSPNQILWNTGVGIGGFTMIGDCSLTPSTGVITCLSTNGAPFGALATLNVGTGLVSSSGNLNLVVPVTGANGGTGVNNGTSTITVGGNTAFSGAFTFTGTLTGNTSVTFPTSGTLLTSGATIGVYLGTSASNTNPQISTDATTGLYTSGAAKVDISVGGNKTFEWGSTGATNTGTFLVSGAVTLSNLSTAGVVVNSSAGLLSTLAGTTTTVLHGNASGASSFGAVTLTTDVTGVLSVANGGTNAATASGTSLDNITGFSSTGFLTRTGAGTYAFQSATNGITLGNIAQIGTNTILGNSTSGTANVTAMSVGGCSTASSALNWTTNTGVGCNTSITAAAVPASGITGTTLASGVVTSSLTTVGTIGTGTWQGTIVNPTYGGTGVNNGAKTITLGGSITTTGAATPTLAFGATGFTFTYPSATSTLAALGVAQTYTAAQTFTNSDLLLLGSSTGATTFTSANSSATNYTLTLPAITDTVVTLTATQTLSNKTLTTPVLGAATATSITFSPTTGGIVGTTTNDNVTTGDVGEFMISNIVVASAVSLTSGSPTNITSITLTAGDWNVWGTVCFNDASTTTRTYMLSWISPVSATYPGGGSATTDTNPSNLALSGVDNCYVTPIQRMSEASSTPIYLGAQAGFATSTSKAYGAIEARRVR